MFISEKLHSLVEAPSGVVHHLLHLFKVCFIWVIHIYYVVSVTALLSFHLGCYTFPWLLEENGNLSFRKKKTKFSQTAQPVSEEKNYALTIPHNVTHKTLGKPIILIEVLHTDGCI